MVFCLKPPGIEIIKKNDSNWQVRDKEFAAFLLISPLPFSSLITQPSSQCIKKGKKKELWEMRTAESGEKAYLVKVYRNTKLIHQLKTLFTSSRALKEFHAASEVARRHIPTFLPVAAGEKKKNGLIQESYVVVEKVEGCTDLAKYLLKDENRIGREKKREIALHLGQLIRSIHEQGILQIDLALNNFLIETSQKGEPRLFFSDFEKVKFLPEVPESQRFEGLAKLNRIGKEISLADRLRFLKIYLCPESRDRKKFHSTVRHLQFLTLKTLKRDGQRMRMTSVYTDCYYKTYRDDEFHGYYRDIYQVDKLLSILRDWDKERGIIKAESLFQDAPVRMKVKRYQNNLAAQAWSNTFTLSLGMIPAILPHAIFERAGTGTGYTFSPVEEKILTLDEFLSLSETQGIAQLSRLLSVIHQFGIFSGRISEETFSFPFENNRATPHIGCVDSFTIQKEISLEDREQDIASLILLLSSCQDKRKVEKMVRCCYFKRDVMNKNAISRMSF